MKQNSRPVSNIFCAARGTGRSRSTSPPAFACTATETNITFIMIKYKVILILSQDVVVLNLSSCRRRTLGHAERTDVSRLTIHNESVGRGRPQYMYLNQVGVVLKKDLDKSTKNKRAYIKRLVGVFLCF